MNRALGSIAIVTSIAACSPSSGALRGRVGPSYPDRHIAPEAYAASLEAAIAEEHGDWPAAVTWLTKARDLDRDALDLQARLGLALCHVGKHDAAMFAFADVLRIDPRMERALTARAKCWMLKGSLTYARDDLAAAVASDPDAIEPQLLLADVEFMNGDHAGARSRLEECARLHPYASDVRERLTRMRRAMDDYASLDAPPSAMSDPRCEALALSTLVGSEAERAVLISARRVACDADDAAIELAELKHAWSVSRSEEVERRAAASAHARVRRWGMRMGLRRLSIGELCAVTWGDAVDPDNTAIAMATSAVSRSDLALARKAADQAPTEPTVARLVSIVATKAALPATDPLRQRICWLAETDVELRACADASR